MDTNKIGALAGHDFAPICQPGNIRLRLAHRTNG
jgi:hypothetical protein